MHDFDVEVSELKLGELSNDPGKLCGLCDRGFAYVKDLLLTHAYAFESIIPGFQRHFAAPLITIKRVEWTRLVDGRAFTFDYASGLLRVNLGHVEGLLLAIEEKIARQPADAPQLAPSEVGKLFRLALFLFVLHEVRHISQGVARYEDIQRLKAGFGSTFVGDLDVLADRDAARVYAVINMIEERDLSIVGYFTTYAQALFFMAEYCFPAFQVPADKPHKVGRALGILLMLGRLAIFEHNRENLAHSNEAMTKLVQLLQKELPLDAALIVRMSPDWNRLTLVAYTTDLQVLALDTPVDAIAMSELCSSLASGDAERLVDRAVRLLRDLRLA